MNGKIRKFDIACMILGNVILALGIAIFKLSRLGNDPFSGMAMAMAQCANMEYAHFLAIFNAVLFIAEFFFGKKYIGVGTFFNALLQGYMVTFFYNICQRLATPTVMWQKLLTVIIGLVIGGIGLSVYQNANTGASPYDSFSLILSEQTHRAYSACRMFTDLVCVLICFIAGGIVNIGTVACIFLLGPVAHIINKLVFQPLASSSQNKA